MYTSTMISGLSENIIEMCIEKLDDPNVTDVSSSTEPLSSSILFQNGKTTKKIKFKKQEETKFIKLFRSKLNANIQLFLIENNGKI